ncbi:MAG: carboxypeptidase regulatory-like domain-containing protein [Fimbriimonadaceae bacterium]|nr:carboxypeptidase regulatory-like domain-containing protein [Fimbriimonadaceae bacterium]
MKLQGLLLGIWLTAATAGWGRPVAGLVLTPSGQPAAGQAVWLSAATDGPAERTTTGADGRFVLDLALPAAAPVTAVTYGQAGWAVLRETRAAELVLRCGPLEQRALQVKASDGTPLAGVTARCVMVRALASGVMWFFNPTPLFRCAPDLLVGGPSDATGALELRLPAGRDVSLRLQAPGRAAATVELSAGTATGPVVLAAAGTIRARLLDPQGRPLAAARANLWSGEAGGVAGSWWPGTTTAADGVCHLSGLPGLRRASLQVRYRTDRELVVAEHPVTVAEGRDNDLGDLRTSAGERCELLVTTPADQPVEGVTFQLFDWSGLELPPTGPDGRTWLRLPAGRHTLNLRVAKLPAPWAMTAPLEPRLEVVAGQTPPPLVVKLAAGSPLHGVVRQPDGTPLSGVHFGLQWPGGRESVTTGPAGEYQTQQRVSAGSTVTVAEYIAPASQMQPGDAPPLAAPAPGQALDFTWRTHPRQRVRGVLRDAAGQPVAAAPVSLYLNSDDPSSPPDERRAITAADGSYEFGVVAAGVPLLLWVEGYRLVEPGLVQARPDRELVLRPRVVVPWQ